MTTTARRTALQLRLLGVALLVQSCAPGAGGPLRPPPITGGHPSVGHALRLELEGEGGAPVRLEAIAGRVTLVCAGDGPEAHAPCRAALERHGDLVAAVGLAPAAGRDGALRLYRDPGGRAARGLELRGAAIVVCDRQRRIVQVIEPPDEAALERALAALLVGDAAAIHSPAR